MQEMPDGDEQNQVTDSPRFVTIKAKISVAKQHTC